MDVSLRCEALDESSGDIIRRHLADPRNGWSVGTYGAIGEFRYDANEPDLVVDLDALAVVTRRGMLSVTSLDGVQPLALIDGDGRRREIAFCTSRVGARRTAVTAIDDVTFDIGIGAPHVDMLVKLRPDDTEATSALRASVGLPLFEPDTPAGAAIARSSPTRILVSPIARLEVHQPIPPPGGHSPDGPHTHLLPKLLVQGLTRASGMSLPAGLYCGLSLYPR